jgi:hypothetical protein
MFRLNVAGSLLAAVLAPSLLAADNQIVTALKNEIKVLREQEKVAVKRVHAQYDRYLRRDRWTDEALRQERRLVAEQEELLLAITAEPTARRAIRTHFDTLRSYLTVDIILDDAQLARLRAHRNAHLDHIKNSYRAKILQLEAQIQTASQKPKK